MTSAMPVQCSTNWAIKPTGIWSFCEFVSYPSTWSDGSGIYEVHIFAYERMNKWETNFSYVRNLGPCGKKAWKTCSLERYLKSNYVQQFQISFKPEFLKLSFRNPSHGAYITAMVLRLFILSSADQYNYVFYIFQFQNFFILFSKEGNWWHIISIFMLRMNEQNLM